MPLDEYEAAFVMLNSNHTCFDQTPAARRLPPSKGEVNKQRYTATGYAVHKCSRRIEFAEGYLEEIKHIDNYKMNAPSRILCEIYWCQQREDWKHMAELILAAIHKLSMFTYLVLLIDVNKLIKIVLKKSSFNFHYVFLFAVWTDGRTSRSDC